MMNAGQLIGSAITAAGTTNSASSGSPVRAALRSRAASRSTRTAIRPTPPQVSRTMPALSGTGAANRWMSAKPVVSSLSSLAIDSQVGTTLAHASSPANTAVR
ncbi:hypothetical protein GCM10018952_46930 [Streptosporangium vulgare]